MLLSAKAQSGVYLECSLQSPRPIMELGNRQKESTMEQRNKRTEGLKGSGWAASAKKKTGNTFVCRDEVWPGRE